MRIANAASITLLLLLPLFVSQNYAQASTSPSFTLLLSTNKATYYPHEDAQAATRFLNGTAPVFGASVTLETMFPNATTWFVWHNTTDENGYATFKFKLDNCPQGEYTVYSTAQLPTLGNASATTKFTVNISETKPPINGTLLLKTTPIPAEVFVNGVLWGLSPQSRTLKPGTYNVAYGDVEGFYTPASEMATVTENITTTVEGIYRPVQGVPDTMNGTLVVKTSPYPANVLVNGVPWGLAPRSRSVRPGNYSVSFSTVEGLSTPADRTARVSENQTTVAEGVYELLPGATATRIVNPDRIDNTHPFIINATEAEAYLKIYSISDSAVIVIRKLAYPAGAVFLEGWIPVGNYVEIGVNNIDVSINATLYIRYDVDGLGKARLDEKALTIHFWNATSKEWSQVETSIDTNGHYAWVNTDHFSSWLIMGQPKPPNSTPTWWVWVVVIALFGLVTVGFLYDRKRKAVLVLRDKR